jgi:hypothetical protein
LKYSALIAEYFMGEEWSFVLPALTRSKRAGQGGLPFRRIDLRRLSYIISLTA